MVQALLEKMFIAGIFSFLVSYYLMPVLIRAANKLRFLDHPDGDIKVHKQPIPFMGGVGIYLGFIASLSLVFPFENTMLWLLLGSTLLLFTGLIDDLKALKPGQKLFGQLIAVLCFLKGGLSLKWFFLTSSWLNMGISAFWMLSVINAFNLVDVMDGLACTLGIVAGVSFLCIAYFFQLPELMLLLMAFMGALTAFFMYNKPPAKIYLGDAGSMFIGGLLAAIPFLFPWSSQFEVAYYVPTIILGIPLLEVTFLVIIRTWLGIPFFRGSPHHFSCYLLQRKNWTKREVLLFTALFSCVLSILGFFFLLEKITFVTLIFSGVAFLACWTVLLFTQVLNRSIFQGAKKEPAGITTSRLETDLKR